MTGQFSRSFLIAVAAVSLSGCSWIFPKSKPQQADFGLSSQPTQAEYGRQQIALGREALDRGDAIAAIIAFSNAQRIPQFAAEAHNGMAIGYARVGRTDLADRYFRLAILEAPDEPRYRGNLVLLQQGTGWVAPFVTASAAELAENGGAASQSRRPNSNIPGVTIERPRNRLVRAPNGELVIKSEPEKLGNEKPHLAQVSK